MKKFFFLLVFYLMVLTSASSQFMNNTNNAQSNLNQFRSGMVMKNVNINRDKAGIINTFNNEENTKGTRFLSDNWVNGDSVLNMEGNYINTASFLFNFDKMTGNLLVTQDKINIMSVAPSGINSYILGDNNKQYIFEHVKGIDSSQFFLALVKNENGYSLYKLFKTKFIPANSRNDGVVQTGSEENEYKDESQYYVVEKGAAAKLINFKPKVIKAALEGSKEKTDTYFRQHKDDAVDESFLIRLITYLNQ